MYKNKEEFGKIASEFPSQCNAIVTDYLFSNGNDVSLMDIALAAYEYSCNVVKEDKFTLMIGFKGFKKLTMTWDIQNPILEPVTAVESAIEIAKEMTINLRKYYDRAQLLRDYKDDINSLLDGIESRTLEECKSNLNHIKGSVDEYPMDFDKTASFIVFLSEEKM